MFFLSGKGCSEFPKRMLISIGILIRHSKHKYAVEMEMFRYINGMGNYCYENRKKYFVDNIMKIWDANRTKFAENMEKESDMKDMLNDIKTVYKKLKDDEESSD